jgi:hypothetical protein
MRTTLSRQMATQKRSGFAAMRNQILKFSVQPLRLVAAQGLNMALVRLAT